MNVTDLQWYGYCLFKALAGLHRQGIVHRDVKPGNFLYSCKINKGYLIDFNLALDTRKNYGTVDHFKVQRNLNDSTTVCRTKSLQPAKSRKLIDANDEGKVCRSLLPPGNLKRKVDKAKVITEASSRNMIKSQGADGSGITSAKDATSTRTLSAERLREPLPSHGRRELLSLVQEALQGGNHESVGAPKSKRKRVAALAGDAGSTLLHITPMPLHANGLAIRGAGLKSKGDGKPAREGPCAGTKGFKAPEVVLPYFKSKLQSIYNREREASLQASLWGDSDERFDNDYISGGNNSFGPRDCSNVEASARARCITRLRKIVGACYPWLHAGNEGLSRVLENWLLTMKVENCMLVISNLHMQKH